jgi:hypothetical protein
MLEQCPIRHPTQQQVMMSFSSVVCVSFALQMATRRLLLLQLSVRPLTTTSSPLLSSLPSTTTTGPVVRHLYREILRTARTWDNVDERDYINNEARLVGSPSTLPFLHPLLFVVVMLLVLHLVLPFNGFMSS